MRLLSSEIPYQEKNAGESPMTYQESFEKCRLQLQLIADTEIIKPDLSFKNIVNNAELIKVETFADKEDFLALDFDWTLISSLPDRIAALRYCDLQLYIYQLEEIEAQDQWERESREMAQLRDALLNENKFLFGGEVSLVNRLYEVDKATRDLETLADLTRIIELAEDYRKKWQVSGSYFARIDQAKYKINRWNQLSAFCYGDRGTVYQWQDLYNRAFTYLKIAVDAIRQCGCALYSKNRRKRERYKKFGFTQVISYLPPQPDTRIIPLDLVNHSKQRPDTAKSGDMSNSIWAKLFKKKQKIESNTP